MWYFSWILGISLACAFAILNAMWYELRDDLRSGRRPAVAPAPSPKRR